MPRDHVDELRNSRDKRDLEPKQARAPAPTPPRRGGESDDSHAFFGPVSWLGERGSEPASDDAGAQLDVCAPMAAGGGADGFGRCPVPHSCAH